MISYIILHLCILLLQVKKSGPKHTCGSFNTCGDTMASNKWVAERSVDLLRDNCGGCYPRIPMRRPKAYSPGQGGSGRSNTDGPHQDYLPRKTAGSFQRCRDRIRYSLYS